jgi:F0F1-type ATP synthase assembly protein I
MSVGRYSPAHFAIRVLVGQLVITAVITGLSLAIRGSAASLSALVGGGIGIIATAYMAFAVMRPVADNTAARAARGFFIGWVVKVAMTVTLLVIAFRSKAVAPLFLVIGYAATYVAYWVAAARLRS